MSATSDLSKLTLPSVNSLNGLNNATSQQLDDSTTVAGHARLDTLPSQRRMIMPYLLPPSVETEEGHQYLVKVKGNEEHPNNEENKDNNNNNTTSRSMDDHAHTINCQKQRRRESNHNRHHSDPDTFAVFTENPNATYGRTDSYCFLEALADGNVGNSSKDEESHSQQTMATTTTTTTTTTNPSQSCGQEDANATKKSDTPIGLDFAEGDDDEQDLTFSSSSFSSQRAHQSLNDMEVQQLSHPLAF
mmetsp:Transcript_16136/g.22496  ORF Transcript_16136/g.22496 Transcript_16136/m.22496 type:complete len:246 (+) Transcript_16136:209-946(+)